MPLEKQTNAFWWEIIYEKNKSKKKENLTTGNFLHFIKFVIVNIAMEICTMDNGSWFFL